MSIFFYEAVLAFRRLRRRPTPTLLTLVTFTVSISLTLLAWSLFHTIFLHNPGFDPNGKIYRVGLKGSMPLGLVVGMSRNDFEVLKEQQTVFSDIAATTLYNTTFVETPSGMERLLSANLSTAAMRMVSAIPLLGRTFGIAEDQQGTAPVVLLAEKIWRGRFNADPGIVGRKITVSGVPATVIGVMPAAFRFPNDQDVWLPLGFNPSTSEPQAPVIHPVVRLKPGISPERAAKDVQVILGRLGPESFITQWKLSSTFSPLREYYLLPEMRSSAMVLFALALVFILVGCTNAANLVMIDFLGKKGEVASVLALGVPRVAVVRGIVIQLTMIAFLAASIAYLLLLWLAPSIHSAMARTVTPYWLFFQAEWHHAAMAAGLAVFSSVIAAVAPIGYLYLTGIGLLLNESGAGNRTTASGWWRRGLMIGQIALLTVLAISAGLLLRSSQHLARDPGYDGGKIFASKTGMNPADFPTPQVRLKTHLLLLDQLERTPGISAAGMMDNPIGFSGKPAAFYAARADELADGHSAGSAVSTSLTLHMLDVLGVSFLEGKPFLANEPATDKVQVIINASLAMKLWPGEAAVGREFFCRFGDPKNRPVALQVRGVVRDFQASGPKASVNDIICFSMISQGGMANSSFLYARGTEKLPSNAEVRGAALLVDPRIAIYFPGSLQQVIDTELSASTLTMRVATAFAFSAVLLCGVGIYSLTVSQILQRKREFGIRLALGIEPQRLWLHFVRSHFYGVLGGMVIGAVGAMAAGRLLQSLLFGVPVYDAMIYSAVIGMIVFVSVIASLPSLGSLCRVNPADCLRSL